MATRPMLNGPRLLLRKLRETMGEAASAQARLDKIVKLIAANMVAEVCSVYVARADNTLELYATEGLNLAAVHHTVMRADEGLVGLVARQAQPLALTEAQDHPAYSYKPETGEEIYHSFLGVPILRGGNALGVVVVQNVRARAYSEEEIEALQTTAMVLAEMVASGALEALTPAGSGGTAMRRALTLKGQNIADGIGLGHVVLHEPRVEIKNLIADDPAREEDRLNAALADLQASIDTLVAGGTAGSAGEHVDVLETFRMFAQDRGWIRRLHEAIRTGLTAEAAVERVQSDIRARLLRQTDPYLRERLYDLDDLANRLLHLLTGTPFTLATDKLPENAILVARNMGPAALLEYQRLKLRGLVLEEGGAASHVAIVARALGIPTVGNVEGITGFVEPEDAIILDGGTGEVLLRPSLDVQAAYGEKARLRARRQEQYRALRDLPCVTRDGVAIDIQMNAGLLVDLPNLNETGAAGVGLFRTEILFMVSPSLPNARVQEGLYRSILEAADPHPVTFRTLDIGGDKVLPYMRQLEEVNPALGWRAVRIGLDRPALLRLQMRAMLSAAAGRELRIMLPMVATLEELEAARALFKREVARHIAFKRPLPKRTQLGVMLEVPALLFDLDRIFEAVDFVSIGTNDLMQFMFAVDRENPRVATRFDALNIAFLRALKAAVEAAGRAGKRISLCGEMAGRPLEALALMGIGFTHFSMSPANIGPTRALVRTIDLAELRTCMEALLAKAASPASIRAALGAFAAKSEVSF